MAQMNSAAHTNISLVGTAELKRKPVWPAFVIAFGIVATLLWTGALGWILFRMIAFLIS